MGDNPFYNDQVEQFHALYRAQNKGEGPPWCYWMGRVALKCPMDLWIYQEIIYDLKPRYIIEGGTAAAGSALFMADLLDIINWGEVITIDLDRDPEWPIHPRLKYVQGDTLSHETKLRVDHLMTHFGPRMLILDDGHDHEHVEKELNLWTPLLDKGDYLIVEDTNLGGPLWGLDRFLKTTDRFERDPGREKFLLTFNPKGYLRCVA